MADYTQSFFVLQNFPLRKTINQSASFIKWSIWNNSKMSSYFRCSFSLIHPGKAAVSYRTAQEISIIRTVIEGLVTTILLKICWKSASISWGR